MYEQNRPGYQWILLMNGLSNVPPVTKAKNN